MTDDDKTVLTGDADSDAEGKKEDENKEEEKSEEEKKAELILSKEKEDAEKIAAEETEKKDADEKAKEAEDAKSDKADGAPAEYADFTVPEGMELDKEAAEAFSPVAKELNLTQEQAQSLVNLQSEQVQKMAKAQEETWAETTTKWREDAKSDKEFGGEAFDENVGKAKHALDEIGTPELRDLLDVTGTGNHPEVIRLLVKVDKLIGEDKIHLGGTSGEGPKDLSKVLYNKSPEMT